MLLGSNNNCFGLENRYLLDLTLFTHWSGQQIYLGVTDVVTEGDFVMMDGTSFNEITTRPEMIYKWASGEPNNYGGRENCVTISPNNLLNDEKCSNENCYGLCEKKTIHCA